MSVGPPVVDKDNAGAECVVYDVVINPNVSNSSSSAQLLHRASRPREGNPRYKLFCTVLAVSPAVVQSRRPEKEYLGESSPKSLTSRTLRQIFKGSVESDC